MEYKYKIFNPEKSKTAQMILSLNSEDIIKRYIEKAPETIYYFQDDMFKVINLTNDDGYLVYRNINFIEIDILKYVVGIMNIKNHNLKPMGCKLNANKIVEDLDALFGEFPSLLNVLEFTKELYYLALDILNFLTKEILSNSLLENSPFNNKN